MAGKFIEKAMKRIVEQYGELPPENQEQVLDQIKYANVMALVEEVKKTDTIFFGDLYYEVQERQKYFNKFEGFRCGLRYFDEASMGFRPGELTIVAGPSNVGKTMIALNIGASAVVAAKKKLLIISMEMTALEIASRMYNMVDEKDHGALMENVIIQTELSVSAKHIAIIIDRIKPDMVIVDHLQFLANQEQGQEYERVSAAIAKLKRLTITHKIPVITISHVAKTRSGAQGQATASDLKGASNIEQDCDMGFMLNRKAEAEYDSITVTLFKHRTKRPALFHKDCYLNFDGVRLGNAGHYVIAEEGGETPLPPKQTDLSELDLDSLFPNPEPSEVI